MTFRQQGAGSSAEPVLYLPDHVGRQRYGAPIEERAAANEQRPLLYFTEINGRTYVVCNAAGERQRIPVDELEHMAQDAAQSRLIQEQQALTREYAHVLTEWRYEYDQWVRDRQRGRVSVGPATFAGNRRWRELGSGP